MRNNADWLLQLGAIDFMRDVGKHFTVNYMMAKESVQVRMEAGISYTEFSYMLLQAYDYRELFVREGVTLQVGGSDQWGNITAGIELIRRTEGGEAHALTFPLVTTSSGTKFGKTNRAASGSIPSGRRRTSSISSGSTSTTAMQSILKFFTLLSRQEIQDLARAVVERPEGREAQQALARDVTTRVHGAERRNCRGSFAAPVRQGGSVVTVGEALDALTRKFRSRSCPSCRMWSMVSSHWALSRRKERRGGLSSRVAPQSTDAACRCCGFSRRPIAGPVLPASGKAHGIRSRQDSGLARAGKAEHLATFGDDVHLAHRIFAEGDDMPDVVHLPLATVGHLARLHPEAFDPARAVIGIEVMSGYRRNTPAAIHKYHRSRSTLLRCARNSPSA